MTYWDQVLQEVLNKNNPDFQFRLTNIGEYRLREIISKNITQLKSCKRRSVKLYFLGPKYKNIYFSRREAESMLNILKGRSIPQVAKRLKLSPRTVEYYIKNMKLKLSCRTKADLIEMVLVSDFLKNVDFE